MSAKYKEERRKRKELEERIRMLEGGGGTNGKCLGNWEILFLFKKYNKNNNKNEIIHE